MNTRSYADMREGRQTFVDLVLETSGQHLIGLIETEDLDGVGFQSPSVDHVEDTTGSSNNYMYTLLELSHVFSNISSSNTCMTLDVHVVA